VAAGDFSNYQLVNSVGGMATQIVRDPIVQTAISSTSRYRKELERMQKEVDEGKSSPANMKKFTKTADKWLSSNKLGENFTGSYTKYFDVDKFAKETFDAIKPDEYTFEQIYLTDESGRIRRDRNGNPIFSPIMTRLEQEGRFPKKVRETLEQIFSDPRVTQQLQITGEYNYEGYSGGDLKGKVNEIRNKRLASYDADLVDLNMKLAAGEDVQSQIDLINGRKKEVNASYDDFLTMADMNPDAVRGMIYKDDVFDNYTSMYSYMKEKRTTHENPGWNQMFKQQQEANAQARHAETMRYNWAKMRQDDNQHKENIRMKIMELQAKNAPETGAPTPRMVDMDSAISLNNLEEDTYNNAAQTAQNAVYDLILKSGALGNAVNETIQNFGGQISPAQALQKIAEQNSKALNMTPEQYTQWLYNKANTHMANMGNANLTNSQKLAKQSADESMTNFKLAQSTRTEIEKEAGPAVVLEVTKNLRTERVRIGGTEVDLTPQDQYDIALAYAGSDWYESAEVKNAAKASQKRLEAKGISRDLVEGIIDQVKVINRTDPKTGREVVPSSNWKAMDAITGLIKVVDRKDNVTSMDRRSKAVQKYYQISPELEDNVLEGKPDEIQRRRTEALGLIGTYQRFGGQASPDFVKNVEGMANIASGKNKGTFNVRASRNDATGQITPKLVFTGEDGKFAGEMTITMDEARRFGKEVSRWWQPNEFRMAETALNSTGNGTTAFSGNVNDPQTYIDNDVLYSKTSKVFPNLMAMPDDVKANISSQVIQQDGQPRTVYIGHLFVQGENGEVYKPKELTPFYSIGEVIKQFQGLTPQMIQLFKQEAKRVR
jgi:hypothetical protein